MFGILRPVLLPPGFARLVLVYLLNSLEQSNVENRMLYMLQDMQGMAYKMGSRKAKMQELLEKGLGCPGSDIIPDLKWIKGPKI
jgi:hypothetical protein